MRKLMPGILLATLALGVLAQLAVFFPQLPARMSSHFDAAGLANGWMSRTRFAGFTIILAAVITALFAGIAWWLQRGGDRHVNLPHKAHWLAPERRASTMAWLRDWLLWEGCATLALVLVMNQFVYAANITGAGRLPAGLGWVAGGFIGWTVLWTGRLLLRFGRIAQPA